MRGLSIKGKLYLLIFIMLIPMFALQVYRIVHHYNLGLIEQGRDNKRYAELIGVSFTNYLERIWDTELSIGLSINKNKSLTSDEIGLYMKEIASSQPSINEYDWVDKNLIITMSSNNDALGVKLDGLNYIDRILGGEEKVVSRIITSRVYYKPTIVVARAVRKDNALVGIVAAALNIDDLKEVLPSSNIIGSTSFGLIDKTGVMLYRNGVDGISGATKIGSATPGIKVVPLDVEDPKFEATVPIGNVGWQAYAGDSYGVGLNKITRSIGIDIIILSIMLLISLIAVIGIIKRIIEPIAVLEKTAQEISKGNYNIRTNIEGNDEVAAAAQAFDSMIMNIEEYDRLKTQFFSTISHELKTPLNIILASIHMISTSCSAEKNLSNNVVRKYTKMMKQNCYRLLRLINNLIDITKIDSGFMIMRIGNHNIVSIVEDISLSVASYAESRGLNLIFDTEVEEKILACDPDKVERIMLNLLSNSIKFTPEGGDIHVNIYDMEDSIEISVKDTGIGIPGDKLEVIFERFRQVDSSLQREHEGSGIGLSLVKALVEVHGGNISVSSQLGAGTEFKVKLPVKVLEADEDTSSAEYDRHGMDKVEKINIEFSDIYES